MSAEKNRALITRFYEAFARRDGAAMAACYPSEARFSDPIFPNLRGSEIGAMWTMLCECAQDFSLTFKDVDAEFRFKDGLIIEHDDRFDFWCWSRQALGAPGVLLGWSGFLRGKVQAEAAKGLYAFQRKR